MRELLPGHLGLKVRRENSHLWVEIAGKIERKKKTRSQLSLLVQPGGNKRSFLAAVKSYGIRTILTLGSEWWGGRSSVFSPLKKKKVVSPSWWHDNPVSEDSVDCDTSNWIVCLDPTFFWKGREEGTKDRSSGIGLLWKVFGQQD